MIEIKIIDDPIETEKAAAAVRIKQVASSARVAQLARRAARVSLTTSAILRRNAARENFSAW